MLLTVMNRMCHYSSDDVSVSTVMKIMCHYSSDGVVNSNEQNVSL